MRVDKYIWAIRLFKTRSLASKACVSEKVKLNGDFIKSSKVVKKNDTIAIKVVPIWKVFKIIDLPKTRVGAKLVGDFSKEITRDNRGFLLSFEDPLAFGKADETEFELISVQLKSKNFVKKFDKKIDKTFNHFFDGEE